MTSDGAAPAVGALPSAACWQCGAEARSALFCPSCHALQPFADGTDYFAAMDVPRCPAIDRAALDQRYYERSRQLHPDRYQNSAPQAQAASAANSALVNRAYRTLKDPVERGRYWLALRGGSNEPRQTTVPADLAAIVFDVQEHLAQLRWAPPDRRAALVTEVGATRTRIAQAEAAALQQLEQNLNAWSAAADEGVLATTLARLLADIAYIRTLLRDMDRTLDT